MFQPSEKRATAQPTGGATFSQQPGRRSTRSGVETARSFPSKRRPQVDFNQFAVATFARGSNNGLIVTRRNWAGAQPRCTLEKPPRSVGVGPPTTYCNSA